MDECVRILDHMPERNPTDGTFELTIRCNLHCKMCLFRHDDSENAELMKNELTAEQWIDLARQAAEAGTFSLTITGGEPLLRPDFCEIWEGIYKQGFIITLYTNATLVTPKVMETLRKYPPHRIGLTLYGASPETYEKVTGSAAAYERALSGFCSLLTLPSKFEFRSTVIKDNYPDMDAMEALVSKLTDGKGILTESRMVYPAVRGGCADVRSCRLNAKENIDLFLRRTRKKMMEDLQVRGLDPRDSSFKIDQKKQHPLPSGEFTYSLLGCEAGMTSFAVTYDGDMIPCQLLGVFRTDSKSLGFGSAWEKLLWQIRPPKLCDKCSDCKLFDFCAACPASRLAESGDPGGYSEYLCEDARELYKYTKRRKLLEEDEI